MNNKEKILALEIQKVKTRNRMGCNEDWYDPYYAIKKTFTAEEIQTMSEHEVDLLVRLAQSISEAFY